METGAAAGVSAADIGAATEIHEEPGAGGPTASRGDNDIMSCLRRSTAAVHERVEAGLGLADPDIPAGRYRDLMISFYRLHTALEPRLEALFGEFEDPLLDWPGRRKLGRLTRDLSTLGIAPEGLTVLPAALIPAGNDLTFGFGALYVTEGATLGGQLIARNLSTRADLADATSYFTPYGDQAGRRWRDLRVVLRRWVGTDRERADAVVEAALGTFLAFEAALH
ncbi:biliverdin-producing heme oxygenase [Frankia sp. Cpl3]|uniref:biliverdin-producing heme oxygenase n=1 Tax=Parafrankia colletiae TaxID=573497 RepID=UPI001F524865|nr:biliverdin-producing heme oxygenase [Parafrankia colletiae]MCK9903398.1 biliverdin-producing heme oxygenase [Frankia sp. Cpl3]